MIIHENGTIYLGKGDEFIEERQDERKTYWIVIIELANGLQAQVQRHYAIPNPPIVNYEGWDINIGVNKETGTFIQIESPYPEDIQEQIRRKNASELMIMADYLREQASSIIIGE